MSKLVLIGAGNMGFAMLRQWAAEAKYDLVAIEPNGELRARAAGLGVETFATPDELPAGFAVDVLMIATKPQLVGDVAAGYAALLASEALVISGTSWNRSPTRP